MKIGFVGLGIMGKPMAKNLLNAGHKLTVFDLNADAVNELAALGAVPAACANDTARNAEVVFTMLPNSPQVKQVMLGENGLARQMAAGSVHRHVLH